MVSANKKLTPPQIRTPVAHSLHQTDKLAFVRRQLEMTSGERPAEERERPGALVEDGAEPHTGGVAVHHEQLAEVGHLEDGPGRDGAFERLEGLLGVRVPDESIPAQETRQGRRDEAEVPDEFPVIPG